MKINTEKPIVENNFKRFVDLCYPDASEEQIEHMRVVFFSGAWWLLSFSMMELDEGTEETDKDVLLMAEVHNELATYTASVAARGRLKN